MCLAELSLPDIPLSIVLIAAGIVAAAIVIINALIVIPTNRKIREGAKRGFLSQLLYMVFMVLIAVLAVSSFGSILQFGHLAGYSLLAHVGAAGAFVFLLVVIAWLYLPRGYGAPLDEQRGEDRWWLARWSAWILIVGSIASAATMFASMLPWLDTSGLLQYAAAHRYIGVLVVVAAIVHLYAMLCTRLGWR
jgi:hypothetical protein